VSDDMKQRIIISIIFLLFLSACGITNEKDSSQKYIEKKGGIDSVSEEEPNEKDPSQKQLSIVSINEKNVFLVSELVELLGGDYQYDELHRLLTMHIDNQEFKIVYGIPVVEKKWVVPTNR
jgi:hypothetical protein